jgi:hypothetical protein
MPHRQIVSFLSRLPHFVTKYHTHVPFCQRLKIADASFLQSLFLLDRKQTGLNLKQLQDPGSLLNHGQSSQGHHIIFTGGCVRSSRTSLTAFLSHEQSAVKNHTIMTTNTSSANVTNFKYLGTTNKSKLQA